MATSAEVLSAMKLALEGSHPVATSAIANGIQDKFMDIGRPFVMYNVGEYRVQVENPVVTPLTVQQIKTYLKSLGFVVEGLSNPYKVSLA